MNTFEQHIARGIKLQSSTFQSMASHPTQKAQLNRSVKVKANTLLAFTKRNFLAEYKGKMRG